MPKVTVSVPHQLDVQEAAERARPALEKTAHDFQGHDLAIQWTGSSAEFSFKSMAFTIKGRVTVDAQQVTVEVDLPFAAMMFKDKAERAIAKNLTRAIEGPAPPAV
ncbi:MAG: polyhydroxyalkanoic acid system family protein [Planctomycetia bacterium]|nr:polyhydroxyalkanoic acid system family protein [Planctomycetia bacterium]